MKDYRNQDVGLFIVFAYAPMETANENIWDIYGKTSLKFGYLCDQEAPIDQKLTKQETRLGVLDYRIVNVNVNDSGRRFSSYLSINNRLALKKALWDMGSSTIEVATSNLSHAN